MVFGGADSKRSIFSKQLRFGSREEAGVDGGVNSKVLVVDE